MSQGLGSVYNNWGSRCRPGDSHATIPAGDRTYVERHSVWRLGHISKAVVHVLFQKAAMYSCHEGWGVSTVKGVAAAGQEISLFPLALIGGRQWKGSAFWRYHLEPI